MRHAAIRTLAPLTSAWGAKWGAIFGRHVATEGLLERSIIPYYLTLSHSQTCQPIVRSSMAWRGSGVRIPSTPPRNTRSEPLCESRQLAVGARLQAFGMAEAETKPRATAKTASTSTTGPTSGTALTTRPVLAGGAGWSRSAMPRTGSGSARRSAADPDRGQGQAQDAALRAGRGASGPSRAT
jgi:hypothetical protein